MRSQGPYFVFNQEEVKVLGQDGWLTGEELRTGSYARGFTTPEGAREAQVALPVIEQSGTCIIRHKTLVKLQEFPEAFNISYGEEASCLDWVLKVISSLNSYQNQVVEEMEKLTQNLSTVDREICDELHYIEFCNLNAAEGYKSYKRLKELQQKRRAIKNSFEMLDAVQVVVSGVSKIEKMVTDPAKKSYTLREPETFIHDWRG